MSRTIVSLVSAQTIPNYLFIKEMYQEGDELMFISSEKFKDRIEWITNTLQKNDFTLILLDNSMEEKWNEMCARIEEKISPDKEYIVNLTGGTKYMSLAVQSVFEKHNKKKLYYLPFPKNHLLRPSWNDDTTIPVKYRVNVEEYMKAYNITISNTKSLTKEIVYTQYLFERYTQGSLNENILEELRCYRDKTIRISELAVKTNENIRNFLWGINFPLADPDSSKINKYEIQYLTGGWFEEFVYDLIKKRLNPEDIKLGALITRRGLNHQNDLDVVFTLGNKLFVIECKTGVGKGSIFNQTVYKAASLKEALLGLPSLSYIFSLSSENKDLIQIAKYMGITYCDVTYFINNDKLNSLIEGIQQIAYD
ncbi:hypothetical protein EZS27_017425 [termite gut metagenome]|uniref:DUF1887 family protein n=1 Tax=termite gut metagenome TaxID=433724 RepID=A0A5J4RM89_9ZZZZ